MIVSAQSGHVFVNPAVASSEVVKGNFSLEDLLGRRQLEVVDDRVSCRTIRPQDQ